MKKTNKKRIESELENNSTSSLILIQFKINNNNNRSISYLQTVKLDELNDLIDIFIEFLNLRDEDYRSWKLSHIVYKIINVTEKESSGTVKRSRINKDTFRIKINLILLTLKVLIYQILWIFVFVFVLRGSNNSIRFLCPS